MIHSRLARRLALLLAALAAVPLLWVPAMAQSADEAMMQVGLDLLYAKNDPQAAAGEFQQVLGQNPKHYGATYQLAVALDRAGRPDEALPVWERMLKMADEISDAPVADLVRARLAQQDPLSEGAMMRAGLDLLYAQHDPADAAAEFRKVLALNPTHYGATYQLATALDRAGQAREARPLWETVLKMAAGYNDAETTAAAEARLATCP